MTKTDIKIHRGFPGSSVGKNCIACNARDEGVAHSVPGWGRFPRGEQYSCLKNPMDRGAWQATIHGVAESRTQMKQLSKLAHKSLQRGLCGHKSLTLLSKGQWSWLLDQIVRIYLKQLLFCTPMSHEWELLFSPHPHQHLMLSVFWILTNLTGVWWYLNVVLICIYLMTSGPITSCQIDGETMETVTDIIFLSS